MADTEPLTGRCLCGAVRYEADASVAILVNCHCRFCRRAQGAAFVTTTPIPTSALRVVAGEDHVARHEGRFFCRTCAGRLWNRAEGLPDVTVVHVTSLDREPGPTPSIHVNLESKAPWYEILDDAPRFDGFPPSVSGALESAD